MAERRPPGFNVDLGFYDSPEVLSIPRKHRASAVGVWTLCGAYAASQLTDGLVSAEKLREFGCTPAIKDALMSTTPEPLWIAGNPAGAVQFTRWPKWQRTRAEVKSYRDSEAERKRQARANRTPTNDQPDANQSPTIEQPTNNHSPVDTPSSQQPPINHGSDNHIDESLTSVNSETSGRTTGGRPRNVRVEDRDPKSETKTETESNTSLTLVEGGPGGDPAKTTAAAKPAAKRRTQVRDDYTPTKPVVATIREENPTVTDEQLRYEHRKFIDHWKKTGKPMSDWDAAWRNWMRTASERGDFTRGPTRNGHSTTGKPTLKALGWQAAGNELLAEMEQHQ